MKLYIFLEIDSEKFYQYNENKLIKWLEIRYEILLKSLSQNGLLSKDILNDGKYRIIVHLLKIFKI